ncbi:iron-containing alcohol dehydrogenase [Extibacter muris]|uniref:iron-containing alcohol dehydrogenase n=1 Tax=Extibacter muris TaxID=1796622 RepID=UPI001D067F06|nr:iron-containing alcohol dehydrogenase [Extibacter muris]MCB6200721.1 iron-containing alcohol dehydrogenase [Extibacter muris]MCQ4665435.1 iron-containing alcohol dehydrogenase [Extibacter muris]MCQ4694768.1 iron-containing alcohol dehydrogenase [Extibacter muris]
MYVMMCRLFQKVMKLVMDHVPFWRKPKMITGRDSLKKLPSIIKKKGIRNVLLVTDSGIAALGLHTQLVEWIREGGVECTVYDRTVANPTIANVEEALALYQENDCHAIIAFGGGSPMDCAKGVGARVARPRKKISSMRGELKILKPIPLLIAIPTTAGTGSETTLAAVLTDETTHEKYAINDFVLIPRYAVLDPVLTKGLPKDITASTGMDALTHAVEAYIGRSNTAETIEDSVAAVKLIFRNLEKAYGSGEDMEAREKMQKASFLAGAAFTRAYVGYVHAIAHSLGGEYGIPHGLANAVILPYVLDAYGSSIYIQLAELADIVKVGQELEEDQAKAEAFIAEIRAMNRRMGIPEKLEGIREDDIDMLAKRAAKEANPLYPVPKIMKKAQLKEIYYQIRA